MHHFRVAFYERERERGEEEEEEEGGGGGADEEEEGARIERLRDILLQQIMCGNVGQLDDADTTPQYRKSGRVPSSRARARVCVYMRARARERERERENVGARVRACVYASVCVCVCVCDTAISSYMNQTGILDHTAWFSSRAHMDLENAPTV